MSRFRPRIRPLKCFSANFNSILLLRDRTTKFAKTLCKTRGTHALITFGEKCSFTIVCEVEISNYTEWTYRTNRGKSRLKITDWQNTELEICFSIVKGKGLKHAGKSHLEICKGANMKTARRALDFPLYIFFLDGSASKYEHCLCF